MFFIIIPSKIHFLHLSALQKLDTLELCIYIYVYNVLHVISEEVYEDVAILEEKKQRSELSYI